MTRALRTLLLVAVLASTDASGHHTSATFPLPRGFEARVDFWVDVFAEHSVRDVIIHDRERPWIVHEVISFEEPFDARDPAHLERVERSQRRHPDGSRFQRGLREHFREGVARSGRWIDAMRAIFRERGLPEDLAFLPHVESAYRNDAHSSAGCVGVWQWSRGTGRLYLRIDRAVDERLDPLVATRAAADHLGEAHRDLGSWPYALTAYNYGMAGMRRAVTRFGPDRFDQVIAEHRSRSFGFASRNFYAEFLAARRIAADPGRWFGRVEMEPPAELATVPLNHFLDVEAVMRFLGLDRGVLASLNPAVLPAFYRGEARLPEGYDLRVPAGQELRVQTAYAAIPEASLHAEQIRPTHHVVRAGENLSTIARRYGTSVSRLVELNGIHNPHRIFRGQRIVVR